MPHRVKLSHRRNCFVLLAVGLGIIAFEGYAGFKGFEASAWPTASAQITKSAMMNGTMEQQKLRREEIEYIYNVHGNTFQNDRIQFGHMRLLDRRSLSFVKRGMLNNYSRDSTVRVHYNPSDPSDSVIEPGLPVSSYVVIGIAAVMCAYAASVLFAAVEPDEY